MKRLNKKFVVGTAFALSMMSTLALTACHETESNLYGPPQLESEYETSQEILPAVYGPPEYFEDETFEGEITIEEDTFDVEQEIEPDVYGPPAN